MVVARHTRRAAAPLLLGILVAAVSFTLGVGRAAQATTLEALSLDEITARAELIVKGWVTAVEAVRDPSGQIYTWVSLDGLEVIHGTHLEPILDLRFTGGALEGEHDQILGMPSFSVGERVLLFVRGNGTAMCPIVGWHQGSFRIAIDSASGFEYLTDAAGNPVTAIDDGVFVQYGRAEGAGGVAEGFAGVPDERDAGSAAPQAAGPRGPLPLPAFLASIDALRGVTPARVTPAPLVDPQGIPIDALAPASVAPARQPTYGRPAIPQGLPDPEPADEE